MHFQGINYDTGTKTITGLLTRETLVSANVVKEIEVIKNELHCNAIRITGQLIERVTQAAEIALKNGLTVWFSPFLQYEDRPTTLKYIIEGAKAAENLRLQFPDLTFVLGCELSLFTKDFIKGETGEQRMKQLFSPLSMLKNMAGLKRRYNARLNDFLEEAVTAIRKYFKGKITYASGTWEKINWALFDIIGVDLYRASYNKSTYRKELQYYVGMGKPLSIMEFGCCTFKGADDVGSMGWSIVDWSKEKPELKGNYIRDEDTQAQYLLELLEIFNSEKVFAVFVFTFISSNYVYNEIPKFDLDMAAYGIVKSLGNGQWTPKRAFYQLAEYYRNYAG